jgi:hypothetical protein
MPRAKGTYRKAILDDAVGVVLGRGLEVAEVRVTETPEFTRYQVITPSGVGLAIVDADPAHGAAELDHWLPGKGNNHG